MADETKIQPGEFKDKEQTDASPTSSKFETCEQVKVDKISEKISPNSKRLKLDNTPPKKDNLIPSTDEDKKVEVEKKDAQEEEKKGEDLLTDSKVDEGKATTAQPKEAIAVPAEKK
jgi:hypothetical protein